jgi:hypothetical protein
MLTKDRILALANYCKEDTGSAPSFGLQDEEKVKTACITIAKAGVAVDMEYFMDMFYFNFKTTKDYEKAVKALKGKVDSFDA